MSAENSKHGVKDKFKHAKGKFKRLWQRDDSTVSTVGDPNHISQRSSRSMEAPPTQFQEAHKLNEGKCDAGCQDMHSEMNSKSYRVESQFSRSKLNAERYDAVLLDKPNRKQQGQSRRHDQSMVISSIKPGSAPPTKPDLWQRAFDFKGKICTYS